MSLVRQNQQTTTYLCHNWNLQLKMHHKAFGGRAPLELAEGVHSAPQIPYKGEREEGACRVRAGRGRNTLLSMWLEEYNDNWRPEGWTELNWVKHTGAKEVDGLVVDCTSQLIGVGEIFQHVDVGRKFQHVLLSAASRQSQQLVQPAKSWTHHVTCWWSKTKVKLTSLVSFSVRTSTEELNALEKLEVEPK